MKNALRKTLFCLVILLDVMLGFAAGKRDVSEKNVDNMDSWQETFDINEKKPGKYNIYVEAEDKGGNTEIAGPYNLYLDPDSDYPVSNITNPAANMRVPGNLNIVGTCVDDDGVEGVWLVLDGGDPVKAQGKEFWSYYLDTNNLEEGPHTIEVWGVDINGLSSKEKPKKKGFVTWNLDRRQPVIEVTNYAPGSLVSGKITLKGTVYDGNGIKSLYSSLDNGKTFEEVKLGTDKKTGKITFEFPVDTKKADDGTAVCWFKAIDKMGSTGMYSFLYFIDNTKPDVKIVSPAADEVCNGKFGIAGFAKDKVGLQKLSWSFGGESGDFELIPGNPYWYKEVDTRNINAKSVDFFITAVDTAGNVVQVKRTILLNQEADKPVVNIEYPDQDGTITGYAGSLYLRGIASDDDGVVAVTYSLDGGLPVNINTEGVFYARIGEYGDIPQGHHKITVYATDQHGIKGNTVTVNFSSMGSAPEFNDPEIKSSTGKVPFVYGMKVHPESNAYIETAVSSAAKIKAASYKVEWGVVSQFEKNIELKAPVEDLDISIPLSTPEIPWGLIRVTISATDTFDRTTEQKLVLNLLDLTKIDVESPDVLFEDSRISDRGDIINDFKHPVTGYFVGGNIKSVSLVPSTPFASVDFKGNGIIIKAEKAEGVSAPVKVRVVTDQNLVYESRELVFHSDSPAPVIKLDNEGMIFDGHDDIHITGSISSVIPLTNVKFRIFSAEAELTGDYVAGTKASRSSGFMGLETSEKIDFTLTPDELKDGMHAIEIVANNSKEASAVIYVKKLPELPELNPANGKPYVAAKPSINWFDGNDVYAVATYQGALENPVLKVSRDEMNPGDTELSFAVNYESGKSVSSKYTARKDGNVKFFIDSIGDAPYVSGMTVPLEHGNKGNVKLRGLIESDFPVTSATYMIAGENVIGGDQKQNGRAAVRYIGDKMYEAELTLSNLPVRFNQIELIAETSRGSAFYKGTFGIVRERDSSLIDNSKGLYWLPQDNVIYDFKNNFYVMKSGEEFGGYANVLGPISVVSNNPAFKAVTGEGNYFYITAENDGLYKNVSVKVYDSQKVEYVSKTLDILVDTLSPAVEIKSPEKHLWVKNTVDLSVSAKDANGIVKVEYSLDSGNTWKEFAAPKNAGMDYTATIDISDLPDGLIGIDVRAIDGAGKTGTASTGIQKDTTPPDVRVIIPAAEDLINGENLIVMKVKDNGAMLKSAYIVPGNEKTKTPEKEFVLNQDSLINTHVGTEDQPLKDDMIFRFTDVTGNVREINKWDFHIDNELDLPIAEVHLPEENAVITRDFEFSGVIFDDDGVKKDSAGNIVGGPKVWYKIDNGEYTELDQIGTSFAIPKKLSEFTDNEHAITVYAVDINGVKGPEYVRNFKISLEEPKGQVVAPPISETVKGTIKMSGVASDKNGIKAVYISVDNGNSYNEAIGEFGHENSECKWSYEFDTRVIEDGTHVVFLKIVDWYGIEGLYSSLINIDNTKPNINLELPLDDSLTTGMVFFSGQTTDNIGLTKLYITVRSLEGKIVSSAISHIDLEPDEIITKAIDLSALENGFYNVELTGMDAADNITRVSCNLQLKKDAPKATVDLLYPLNGEHVQGVFNIYGTAVSEVDIENLYLYIDNKVVAETKLSASGYYKFNVTNEMISDGQHSVRVEANLAGAGKIVSNIQYLNYSSYGPWITIDNFTYGDFAVNRPYIEGKAGYVVDPESLALLKAKNVSKEVKEEIEGRSVSRVEISFNNGKTFEKVSSKGAWRYRVENKDIPEGYHFLLVRATMKNGEVAVTRCIVQVDSTKPSIKLISPGLGGHYNQQLVFRGLSHDDIALKRVTLALRQGDKSAYEIPSFIQGLYFDVQFWGATLFNVGAGLTFFDDNVKVQVQWGQFTQSQRNMFSNTTLRYGGSNIWGMKILANVAYIPFRYFMGPDFEWLSANIAIGADFTRFDDSQSGEAQVLSALIGQLEFPRVALPRKRKFLKTYSFYTEGQLWFIPTDVSSSVSIKKYVPQISFGLRANVF